jgi:hypothetical protein
MRKPREKSLYPLVERWLKRHYRCFATGINTGLRYSRIDVVGVRDVGGDLSGEVESIVVEVKRGTEPFATASGQALGYRVYVNRIYLADYRLSPFTFDEIHIASHIGIGLIQIRARKCIEVLSSPHYKPITKLNLALMERLALGFCQICNSVFRIGEDKHHQFANLARENFKLAFDKGKGLMFWNQEVANRKNRLGIRQTQDGSTYERRFICPDCVDNLLSQFSLYKEK